MTSLLDLAPSTVTVHGVRVYGVSLEGIALLIGRFPELRTLISGGSLDVTFEQVLERAPAAVSAIIAAGTGNPGDAKHEEAAKRLGLEMQADFLEAIVKATMPAGFGPFVKRIEAWASKLGGQPSEASATAPASTSPPSSTKSYKRGVSRRI